MGGERSEARAPGPRRPPETVFGVEQRGARFGGPEAAIGSLAGTFRRADRLRPPVENQMPLRGQDSGDGGHRTRGADGRRCRPCFADGPRGFADLFDRHAGSVNRYVAKRVAREDAEDLVGETFATAFCSRERFDLTRPKCPPVAIRHRHQSCPPLLAK